VAFLFPASLFAKEINLYDQPKSDAKAIATIDLSAGIIPIFTPKAGGWTKVADPRNGNVGWVKSSDLASAGSMQSTFTFAQTIVNDNKAPTAYRIVQLGEPKQLTPEQSQALLKQMQMQHEAIQKSMQDMMRDMDKLFLDGHHFFSEAHVPLLMPIFVVPAQKTATEDKGNAATKQSGPVKATQPQPEKPTSR
jgi:hypothetical protein